MARHALTVLVADDTSGNQKIVKRVLVERGHRVTVVSNGREAVDKIGETNFDAVLMDIQMPVMDGYQAAAAIRDLERSTGKHTPIIALTAHATSRDREACLEAGMDAYLTKPIVVAELIAAVESTANLWPRSEPLAHIPPRSENKPTQNVMDLAATMRRLGGDQALFERFVEVFNEDAPQLLATLSSAVPARDASATTRAAHSLRGLAANFGAEIVVQFASQLEDAGKQNDWQETGALLQQLSDAVNQLRSSLPSHERS